MRAKKKSVARAKKKSPAEAGLIDRIYSIEWLLRELRDLMRETRYFAARIVLVNDVALRGSHQFRLCARHRFQCSIAIAALDCFFDIAHRAAHLRATRFVDQGAASNLARRLAG